ncbi:hypothetical protein GCM10007304_17810 [Rhodococcoides trifolii]|uniref:Uncharacterized protein n=1 Tax=Rhodococcoides trifolii TaxID=908250 RepID=A0A917CY87_9NOCA|nr:hypothetical protein [Rhodococcus trifolii]GGG04120.1 hypothetical protein GCM10007304_17810 [Rhodococcus trifolii]
MTATVTIDEFLACEVAVLRALELAGKRCRGRQNGNPRQNRAHANGVPDYLLYTRLFNADTPDGCDRLLDGAWDHLALVLPGRHAMYEACDIYVRGLLVRREPHTRDRLVAALVGHGE